MNLSQRMGKSAAFMPQPSSWICRSCKPPPYASIFIAVAPASIEFSINSFKAADGDTTTSPAAILLIHYSLNIKARAHIVYGLGSKSNSFSVFFVSP